MTTVAIGRSLPALQLQGTQGLFDTNQLAGQAFVLYFYPKDNTPGCTTEAQDFRDLHHEFQALSCQIIGVSRDSLASHQKFSDKFDLPFTLVSDPDEILCSLFDVIQPKNMFGKQVRGLVRSTFLFDASSKLVQEWRGVKVAGHARAVLQAVRQLQA